MREIFVTGAGTGVGKTLVGVLLARALHAAGKRVRVAKPVVSGFEESDAAVSDGGLLLAALGLPVTPVSIEVVSPWRFRAPLSPDMAAAREDKKIDFTTLISFCDSLKHGGQDVTLIEGVGGVMVPLTEKETVLDWMATLRMPAIVVTGSYLGALSHTLTAAHALKTRDVPVIGVVVSESEGSDVPLDETRATLARFLKGVPVESLARLAADDDGGEAGARLARALGLL